MSDTSTTLRQYPRPDKRTRSKVESSPTSSASFISEKKEARSELIEFDNFIESQVNSVSRSNIERWINSITSFHNRHSKSMYIHQVANWLKKELEISGYKGKDYLYFHTFKEEGFEMRNVICKKEGKLNKYILICGHYDTILGDNVEDTVSRAPGANDNASIDSRKRDVISKEDLEKSLQRIGVNNDTTIIVYGDFKNWFATFAFWIFKYYGVKDVG